MFVLNVDICIKEFLNSFRASFPSSNISPSLHLLEDHAVEQLRKFRVGFSLLNEQGGELIHTDFNRTGRVVHGMRDPLQRLLAVMRRHLVGTTPEVQTNIAKTSRKHEYKRQNYKLVMPILTKKGFLVWKCKNHHFLLKITCMWTANKQQLTCAEW